MLFAKEPDSGIGKFHEDVRECSGHPRKSLENFPLKMSGQRPAVAVEQDLAGFLVVAGGLVRTTWARSSAR
jgi:hypothetical protein